MDKKTLTSTVAFWMVGIGCEHTQSGNYCIYSDEIERAFGIDRATLDEIRPDVLDFLAESCAVAEVGWADESGGCFDLMFWLGYCGLSEDEE